MVLGRWGWRVAFAFPPMRTFRGLDLYAWASRGLSSFADGDREEVEHDFSTDHAFSVSRGKTFSLTVSCVSFQCSPMPAGSHQSPCPLSVHAGCSWPLGDFWKLLQPIRGSVCSFFWLN